MAYNSIITRPDAQSLVPEEVAYDLVRRATDDSAALTLFRRVPVARNQVRFPVLSALPLAYWVTGDTGLKQTTEVDWTNKFLNIEEAATIMPIPDAVVADAELNIWDEAFPYLIEALGRLVDSSVFFGTGAPSSFPTNILAAAVAAGNTTVEGTADAAHGGFFGDIDAALSLLETDGFDSAGMVARRAVKSKLRSARNTLGDQIDRDRVNPQYTEFDGDPIKYPMRGLFPTGLGSNNNPELFVGDWSQFVLGVRTDITMDVFREGVIQDNTGAIVFNLMQQDMTAVRLTFRLGWQVANIINYDQPVEANRYPVAAVLH